MGTCAFCRLASLGQDLHGSREPLESLAAIALIVSLHIVECVCNHNGIHNEDDMVNRIEELVGDTVAKVRRATDDQKSGQYTVAGNHDLLRELVAKRLFAIRAQRSKEKEEENSRKKDNRHHGVAEVDMNSNGSVQRHEAVDNGLGQGRNGKSGHGERDKRHLEENGMHRSKLEGWRDALEPKVRSSFRDLLFLLLPLDQSKMACRMVGKMSVKIEGAATENAGLLASYPKQSKYTLSGSRRKQPVCARRRGK